MTAPISKDLKTKKYPYNNVLIYCKRDTILLENLITCITYMVHTRFIQGLRNFQQSSGQKNKEHTYTRTIYLHSHITENKYMFFC